MMPKEMLHPSTKMNACKKGICYCRIHKDSPPPPSQGSMQLMHCVKYIVTYMTRLQIQQSKM